jgi:regulator of sirC expression with transglutaminase-like and TPR domain
MSTTDPTLDALINLLDDQDELVYQSVKEKLLSLGSVVLPKLEDALQSADSIDHVNKLEEIIYYFKKVIIVDRMRLWISNENRTLLEGWLLASSIHHPNISKEKVENTLQKIYRDVWLEIAESMTSLEKVAVINHILFRINHFEISNNDSPSVDNIVLDKLLFSKTGDVYSLTILYLIIARSLNLDLIPIMLSNKLLLVYEDKLATSLAFGTVAENYLFYINVAHKGSVISPKDVQFLYNKSLKYGKAVTRLENDISLIKKILNLLYLIYTEEGDQERLLLTEDILALMESY